jgi:metal-sulfur cluster biosynthetic enzyme
MKVLKKQVIKKLAEVFDPELNISIVDMGFINDVKIKGEKVDIKMTLTTIGCPLFSTIEAQIKKKLLTIKWIKKVNIKLVFDPPWTIERMSKKAKAILTL